jgi:hypothetical protein
MRGADPRSRLVRLSLLGVTLLGVVVLAGSFAGDTAESARRGRGYGGPGGGRSSKRCIAGRSGYGVGCNTRLRTCKFCTREDLKQEVRDCGRDRQCRREAKGRARAELRRCKESMGACKNCCRGGAESCDATFAGTSGYPSYFRKVKRCRGYYGNRHCRTRTYKPDCSAGGYGGPGDGPAPACVAGCERQAESLLRRCLAVRRRTGTTSEECEAAAAQHLANCLTKCGVTSTTATSTSTTTSTTFPPGSPSGAFSAGAGEA